MVLKAYKLIYLFISCCILCCIACNTKEGGQNFLFDMGPEGSVTEKGFVSVTPATRYTPEKGYGWMTAPQLSFDSVNLKYGNALLYDGVLASDSLVFRADVPNGEYFVTITVGGKDDQPLKMHVSANRQALEDTLVTAQYRIIHKTLRRRIRVKDNNVLIGLSSRSTPVGLLGIEIRPVTPCKTIPFRTALDQDTAIVKKFAQELREAESRNPRNIAVRNQLDIVEKYLKACYYYEGGGWLWAVRSTGMSLIHRLYAAEDLLEQVCADPEDPLYYRAVYLLGKIHYWQNEEDNDVYHEQRFKKYFDLLKPVFPDNEILRMYLGERIPHSLQEIPAPGGAPLWAVYQHEAICRMLELIHWWVGVKQAPNGEMGGKYGDDVELLRWWLPAILGADDSTARAGYKRLADGVWNSGLLERGFSRRIDDVEHSAELFRDTHPGMFLISYGDPEYVERCMLSMQNFRDLWTGITSHGHRHFRSYYISATAVLDKEPYGVDIPLNARAALPGLWAAWYNENPDILRLFKEWGTAWIEDAERTDHGKPRGIIPSAVSFEEDRIGGYSSKWYDPHLTYDYYKWESLGHVSELYNQLVGMYGITGDVCFLKPVNEVARIMTEAEKEKILPAATQEGTLDWAKGILLEGGVDKSGGYNPLGKVFAMAKRLTGGNAYDPLIYKYGQPYNRYLLTGNKEDLVKALEQPLDALRYNFPLLTSEVKFTDRVYVPGSNILSGMYNGHFGAGYEYPALIASWEHTGRDVAVLVRKGDRSNAEISLFNFGAEKQVTMKAWQLEPGRYRIRTGIDSNDDDRIDDVLSEKEADLRDRVNRINIQVPAGKLIILSIEQIRSYGKFSLNKPDLALTSADISFSGHGFAAGKDSVLSPADSISFTDGEVDISAEIHNIGSRAAKDIIVELVIDGSVAASTRLAILNPPRDLDPSSRSVHFKWKATTGRRRVGIRVQTSLPELTDINNYAFVELDLSRP